MKNHLMKSKKRVLDENIMLLARSISKTASKAFKVYSPEVGLISGSGCMDRHRNETALNGILDFCRDKKALELFKKLCRYYYGIDPHATAGYVRAYRDMWDDPVSVKHKKTDGKPRAIRTGIHEKKENAWQDVI